MLLISTTGLLAGCNFLHLFPTTTALKNIQVVAEVNANQSSATAIDIAFVYESDAVALLPKTGPEWFAKKASLLPGLATAIDVVSVEVPPATLATIALPSRASKAIGVYCFINYVSAGGQAAGNLTPYKKMVIWLTPNKVIYKGN